MKYRVIVRPEAEEEKIIVLAVLHGMRRPGLLKKRIDNI